jgi:predicted RNA-binding protein with PUA-like domain
MMRDEVKLGDLVFIYHSSCKHIGVAGIAKVVKEAYPDNPRWVMVDIEFVRKLDRLIPLAKRGNRLSIMPVSEREWQTILDQE